MNHVIHYVDASGLTRTAIGPLTLRQQGFYELPTLNDHYQRERCYSAQQS